MRMLGYLYEAHLPPYLPPCGVATTHNCGVLQQIPTASDLDRAYIGLAGRTPALEDSLYLDGTDLEWL